MSKVEPEYHEGKKALDSFNKAMTQVFKAPKSSTTPFAKPKRKPKKASKG